MCRSSTSPTEAEETELGSSRAPIDRIGDPPSGAGPSHVDDVESGIESAEIVSIGGDHEKAALAGDNDSGGVDHVRGAGRTAQLAGRPRCSVVEDDDVAHRRSEKPDETDLARSIPPHLAHDAGRNDKGVPVVSARATRPTTHRSLRSKPTRAPASSTAPLNGRAPGRRRPTPRR